jgi:DNA mismatch repair ATPase MutS
VKHRAVGLATTHDLALTQVADRMSERAANYHLADTIKEGEVLFDYRLHPGVVQRGNALALMRAVGLEVTDDLAPYS